MARSSKRGGMEDRCATAAELAKGTVPEWRKLGLYEERMPGDIMAMRIAYADATGHTAIHNLRPSRRRDQFGLP